MQPATAKWVGRVTGVLGGFLGILLPIFGVEFTDAQVQQVLGTVGILIGWSVAATSTQTKTAKPKAAIARCSPLATVAALLAVLVVAGSQVGCASKAVAEQRVKVLEGIEQREGPASFAADVYRGIDDTAEADAFFVVFPEDASASYALWPVIRQAALDGIEQRLEAGEIGPRVAVLKQERVDRIEASLLAQIGASP